MTVSRRERRGQSWRPRTACLVVLLGGLTPTATHALEGNRLFPGTLAIDDPAIGDSVNLPTISLLSTAADGTRDNVYGFSFSRRLTDSIAIIVDTGAIQQFAPNGRCTPASTRPASH